MNEVYLYITNLNYIHKNEDMIKSFIAPLDLEKAKRFKMKNDYLRKLASSYLIRKYTGQEELFYNQYGKPYKKNIYFNVSHSGNYIVLAVAKKEIGIDIEIIKDFEKDFIGKILNDDEIKLLNEHHFIEYWTAKEAIIKALGETFPKDIRNINIQTFDGINEYKNELFYLKQLSFDNHILTIALKDTKDYNITIKEKMVI